MTLRQKQDATKEKRQIEALEAPPLSEVPNAASKSASLFRPKHQAAVATVAAAASSGLDIFSSLFFLFSLLFSSFPPPVIRASPPKTLAWDIAHDCRKQYFHLSTTTPRTTNTEQKNRLKSYRY